MCVRCACMYKYSHVCGYTCMCECAHVFMWKPEVDIKWHHMIETGYFIWNWGSLIRVASLLLEPQSLPPKYLSCTYVGAGFQTPPLHLGVKCFTCWAKPPALALPWFHITSFLPNSLSFIIQLWPMVMLSSWMSKFKHGVQWSVQVTGRRE